MNELNLVPYCVATGAEHMAKDSWLLDQHTQDPDRIFTLRFYSWLPSAISLGCHQKQIPEHWQELTQNLGMDMVHRPSGGRAVLHKGDLTYAVITKVSDRHRQEVYQSICEFLIDGMAELGIKLSYGTSGRGYIHNPSCFATATNADLITADGYKVIGSAQVYRQNSVLQHGSIQIQPDRQLLKEIFNQDVPVAGLRELITLPEGDHELISVLTQTLAKSAAKLIGR